MAAEATSQEENSESSVNRLQEEHRRYSQQLELLSRKQYLSEDEKLEEVRLKKLKLNLKDRIFGFRSAGPALQQ